MTEYLELGLVGAIFAFAVKEFFGYLKSRKQGNGTGQAILTELKSQNENHLHSIQEGMNEGFNRMIDCYNQNSREMIEILGRIDGKLSK